MAQTFGGDRVTAIGRQHGLTDQRALAIARQINRSTFSGMVAFLDNPANWGADEAAWAEAFPPMAGLPIEEQRFVMHLICDLGGGIFVP